VCIYYFLDLPFKLKQKRKEFNGRDLIICPRKKKKKREYIFVLPHRDRIGIVSTLYKIKTIWKEKKKKDNKIFIL
jgi:hypothetical protein